jgi:hypothetical protein
MALLLGVVEERLTYRLGSSWLACWETGFDKE